MFLFYYTCMLLNVCLLICFFWGLFYFLKFRLFVCLNVCSFACMFVCLFVCFFVCLFVCLFARSFGWLVGWLVGWLLWHFWWVFLQGGHPPPTNNEIYKNLFIFMKGPRKKPSQTPLLVGRGYRQCIAVVAVVWESPTWSMSVAFLCFFKDLPRLRLQRAEWWHFRNILIQFPPQKTCFRILGEMTSSCAKWAPTSYRWNYNL